MAGRPDMRLVKIPLDPKGKDFRIKNLSSLFTLLKKILNAIILN
jgi:hypothetical protein